MCIKSTKYNGCERKTDLCCCHLPRKCCGPQCILVFFCAKDSTERIRKNLLNCYPKNKLQAHHTQHRPRTHTPPPLKALLRKNGTDERERMIKIFLATWPLGVKRTVSSNRYICKYMDIIYHETRHIPYKSTIRVNMGIRTGIVLTSLAFTFCSFAKSISYRKNNIIWS